MLTNFFSYKTVFLIILWISVIDSSQNDCGLSDQASGLIIDGKNVSKGKWPWLVALLRRENEKFFCGASLISSYHVLTAAHCIHPKFASEPTQAKDIIAYLGRHSLANVTENNSVKAKLKKVDVHPEWNPRIDSYDADLAVIQLEIQVIFNTHTYPICMWNKKLAISEENGVVAGWGQVKLDAVGIPSLTPREVDLTIVTNEECFLEHYHLTFISSKRTFCAISREIVSGVCLGDSGGGFYVKFGRNWFLRGIVSSSLTNNRSCDVTKHSVHTDLVDFTEWLQAITGIKIKTSTGPTLKIITRAMWNLYQLEGPNKILLEPPSKRIMIAHTVTDECDDLQECIEIMQSMQRFHLDQDFNDIHCNFFIGGDGLVLEGRGWKVRGEHTRNGVTSHNDAVCVAFIGNFSKHEPKQVNIDALFKLIQQGIDSNMLVANYVINAQRDFHASLSPGDAFYRKIRTWPKFKKTAI